MPTHRKQSKRRRKKGRNRKRKLRIKNRRKISENKVNEKLNLILEPRKNRDAKSSCSDCKIRKRKGRKLNNGKISPQILRKILEKVADDTLSGARAGDGTITSILEDANQDRSGKKQKENGWSYNQHWMNVANGNDLVSDRKGYRFGKLSPNFYMQLALTVIHVFALNHLIPNRNRCCYDNVKVILCISYNLVKY